MMETVKNIEFLPPQTLIDGDLELRDQENVPPDHERGFAPYYHFQMIHRAKDQKMGHINLRIGHTHNLETFRGHLGFAVDAAYRGQAFAQRACQLLIPLIKHHHLKPLYLTCNLDNQASQKIFSRLGAQYIGTVEMDDDYPYACYYPPHARIKKRYRWDAF